VSYVYTAVDNVLWVTGCS